MKSNKFANIVAKTAKSVATKGCGAASAWCTYQPVEPKKVEKSEK